MTTKSRPESVRRHPTAQCTTQPAGLRIVSRRSPRQGCHAARAAGDRRAAPVDARRSRPSFPESAAKLASSSDRSACLERSPKSVWRRRHLGARWSLAGRPMEFGGAPDRVWRGARSSLAGRPTVFRRGLESAARDALGRARVGDASGDGADASGRGRRLGRWRRRLRARATPRAMAPTPQATPLRRRRRRPPSWHRDRPSAARLPPQGRLAPPRS